MNNKVSYTNTEQFENDVLKSDKPIVLNIYAEGCPPCAQLKPKLNSLAEKYGDRISFIKMLAEKNLSIIEKYEIKSTPTILFFNHGKEVRERLTGYISNTQLQSAVEAISGNTASKPSIEKFFCDVLILGAGPAGLSSSIYTSRAMLNTIIVEKGLIGGKTASTFKVDNYPGTKGVISGRALTDNMLNQAKSFGAQIHNPKEILESELSGKVKCVRAEDAEYYAKAVIIATGAVPRRLPAIGENKFHGRGIHYCAVCDGKMYQNRNIVVIGGGNSALEEAIFLTRFAKNVTIIHQFDHFQACRTLQEEVFKNKSLNIIWDSEVRKINGERHVKNITIENIKTGKVSDIYTDGVFVYIGMESFVAFLNNQISLSSEGYIITNTEMETNIRGVFAAGDVRDKNIRQIATAVGDGVTAALSAEKYLC